MTPSRFRVIDTAGSELGTITDPRASIDEGDAVVVDGIPGIVVEVYDDEDGTEGDVTATLVVDR